jgi:ADP-ribosyl-[dinitrogen reductase] hydrolase
MVNYDKALGAFRGLAVGDALGAPVEFQAAGSFAPVTAYRRTEHFNLEPGQWTDDTSMALCLADALVTADGYSSVVTMDRYLEWYEGGLYSPTARCFDIGIQTRQALIAYRKNPVLSKTSLTDAAGNGTLMRLAPAAIAAASLSTEDALQVFTASALDTHYSDTAVHATTLFGLTIRHLLLGTTPEEAFAIAREEIPEADEVAQVVEATNASNVSAGGYAVTSFGAAWWCFTTTASFEEAVLKAVNLGGDADTIGAITGQLAGAYYGDSAIPARWRQELWDAPLFEYFTKDLLKVSRGLLYSRAVDYF